jgi:hypothetical protein
MAVGFVSNYRLEPVATTRCRNSEMQALMLRMAAAIYVTVISFVRLPDLMKLGALGVVLAEM